MKPFRAKAKEGAVIDTLYILWRIINKEAKINIHIFLCINVHTK